MTLKKINLLDLFFINFTLFFILAFLHFLFDQWVGTHLNKIFSILLLFVNCLILIKLKRTKIKKEIHKMSIFILFLFITLIYSTSITFLSLSIMYSFYIITELLFLIYIFSNTNYEEFKKVVLSLRNAYLITTIPLFLLYILDIINLYNFPNRFIVFDLYRFGGFVSEPRGMAIFSILILASILITKRNKNQNLEVIFLVIVIFSTFSNAAILFIFIFPPVYYILKANLKMKVIYLFLSTAFFSLLWIFMPDITFGRLTIDKESISEIFNNLSNISDIDVGGVNAFNIRLWIFLKGVMEISWYGLGFLSANNLAILEGLPQANAIGIITILSDFGYFAGGVILLYLVYIIHNLKYVDMRIFTFMTVLLVLLLMSPPYAVFYLPFFVYFIIMYNKAKNDIYYQKENNV
jgi:hypothetical protein